MLEVRHKVWRFFSPHRLVWRRWLDKLTLRVAVWQLERLLTAKPINWPVLIYWTKRAGNLKLDRGTDHQYLEAYLVALWGCAHPQFFSPLTSSIETSSDYEANCLNHDQTRWVRESLAQAIFILLKLGPHSQYDLAQDILYRPPVEFERLDDQPGLPVRLFVDFDIEYASIVYDPYCSFTTKLFSDYLMIDSYFGAIFWGYLFERLK